MSDKNNTTKVIRFDWFIKRMMRDKSNYKVLEGFLTALLKKDIQILNILESEGNQDRADLKFNRVDLLVKDNRGNKIIIEIQNERESDYLERILFGTSKIIIDHFKLGAKYKEINKVISISILYFNLGTGQDYIYYGTTEFYGVHTKEKLKVKYKVENNLINKPNIFPEYYIINVERFSDIVKDDVDEWIYMLKNSEIKNDFKSKYIKDAKKKLDVLKLSKDERKKYEKHLEAVAIERDIMNTAKSEGREEGRKEGREEGREEGIIEGELKLIFKLLNKKFANIPDDVKNLLNQKNNIELEKIAVYLIDVKSLDELKTYLKKM